MNTNIKQTLTILFVFFLLFMGVKSMNGQNNCLKISGKLTLAKEEIQAPDKCTIKILDLDTDSVVVFESGKHFSYSLKYNKEYMIVISKDQYQAKSIFVNTYCSSSKKFKYNFECDLVPDEIHDGIVFQAGGIKYCPEEDNFVHKYH